MSRSSWKLDDSGWFGGCAAEVSGLASRGCRAGASVTLSSAAKTALVGAVQAAVLLNTGRRGEWVSRFPQRRQRITRVTGVVFF
jgi:hypothetical protein